VTVTEENDLGCVGSPSMSSSGSCFYRYGARLCSLCACSGRRCHRCWDVNAALPIKALQYHCRTTD